jgi:hypothetical protein
MRRSIRWLVLALAVAPLAACGGSGARSADGIVARLTGDDDAEVSDAVENLIEKAFAVPADGAPIDD